MLYYKILFLIMFVSYIFVFLCYLIKHKTIRAVIFLNSFSGLFSMFVINLTSFLSGIFIPINSISVLMSSLLGIPGVCLFLLIDFLFIK